MQDERAKDKTHARTGAEDKILGYELPNYEFSPLYLGRALNWIKE
jgi:hypothetical protein